MSNRTRYFVNPYGEILTIQYSVTEAHPDYVPQIKDARDVTDNVTEIDGMLECPVANNKHGVVVRSPVPEPTQWEAGPQDLVGDIARGKAIIEAQAEAIYLDNPEYIPAGHSDNWLTKEPGWTVNGTRTGRIPCALPNLSDKEKEGLRNGVWSEDDDMETELTAEWVADDAAVLTKDEEAIVGSAAAPGKYYNFYSDACGPPAGLGEDITELDGIVVQAQGHKVEKIDEHAGMVQNPMTGEWGWGFF